MGLSILWGVWLFTGFIYHGEPMPPLNPSLQIRYEFQASGENTLHYFREGEQGFCERRARYEYDGGYLAQQVIWVNPDNASWCSRDTDMQMNNHSVTPMQLEENVLHLILPLGEEELTYVWKKVTAVKR
ncbi:MAG: hypothetical protein AAGB31_11430 [Bdellovibrio sp.]